MQVDLLIDNEAVPASGHAMFDRHNPATGQLATRAAAATCADADAAADAAAAAFPAWSNLGPSQRRTFLLRAADQMSADSEEFVDVVVRETGATPGWAQFNVALSSNMLREAASMTTQITGELIPSDKPGCIAMTMRQAAGVVLGIAPWNAPIILGVRAVAMPLACGNTVVLKASELCPGSHWMIGEVFRKAGLPKGVVNVITNAPADAAQIVDRLIAHQAVRRINFTGSTRVGRIIAEKSARLLKPCLLELGGKASVIVLDDADMRAAVNAVAFGGFLNQGQICMSTERVIVVEGVAEEFVSQLTAKASTLKAGAPSDSKAVLGMLISEDAARRVRELLQDAVSKGAVLTAGGMGVGAVVPASVLDHVTPSMRIYSEESFGPVVSMVRVKDADAAVRVANDTEYGLSNAVFSRNISRALTVARQIQTGICHVNGPTVHDEAQMPFGGVKASGYGRFGGREVISEFTDLRWITIDTADQHYPF